MNGYIDLQVNGYSGVDFNSDELTDEDLIHVCDKLSADGVEGILATIITAPVDLMSRRLTKIADAIERLPPVRQLIRGLHIEGPFISPSEGCVGAHPADAVRPPSIDVASELLEAARGYARLMTLAPEMDASAKVTRFLSDCGVIVAAGHSDATLDQLSACLDAGLALFTHLGNGCPANLPRHDNIIQRVLSLSDRLMVSFIADGHHIPVFALGNYLRCVPAENVVLVTDAISAAGLGPGHYQLAGQTVEVDEDGSAWAAGRGHYAGCATTLKQMRSILSQLAGIDEDLIDRWMIDNPRRLLETADQ